MARSSARALWAAKLAGRAVPAAADPPALRLGRSFTGIVLGIDPSLRGTGLAVLEVGAGQHCTLRASRTVHLTARHSMPDCLGAIFQAIASMLSDHPVRHVALEQTIFVQNYQTAQILGAARGAAIAAAAVRGLPVFEYAPLRIKQAVVGFGRASKEQVSRQMRSLLGGDALLASDEADAAAVALCHALTWKEP